MTRQEFKEIPWKIGQSVRLTNDKIYKILSIIRNRKRYKLTLYSAEYNAVFNADNRIIEKFHSTVCIRLTLEEKAAFTNFLKCMKNEKDKKYENGK